MNEAPDTSPQNTGDRPKEAEVPVNPPDSRSIGMVLSENYAAVSDDLQQAHLLAANLEQQLAGKSKELLHLKFLFEQTKTHMGHLQDGIAAMRKERHKLANDSMRAQGLEIMVKRLTAERDRYKTELESVLEGIANEKSQEMLSFDKRDHRIAEVTLQLMEARQEIEHLKRFQPQPAPAPAPPPPREMPLKTSASEESWTQPEPENMEVIPTERVAGRRP